MDDKLESVKKVGMHHYVMLSAAVILVIVYALPRVLVATFGVDSPWTSYFYKYGFGAIFFFIGVFLTLKSGACDLKRGHDRFWFRFLIIGFFWYLGMHGLWILASLHIPFLGDL